MKQKLFVKLCIYMHACVRVTGERLNICIPSTSRHFVSLPSVGLHSAEQQKFIHEPQVVATL